MAKVALGVIAVLFSFVLIYPVINDLWEEWNSKKK